MTFLKQVLTIFLIAGAILTTGLTAAVDNPLVIDGYPLRITVYDDSTMHVENNQCGGPQYNENSKGSILLMYGDKLRKWGGGHNTFVLYNEVEPLHFTPVSNTLVDTGNPFTFEIATVYLAGMTNEIQVTQTVSYVNGTPFYKIVWEVTNNGAETYTDLRFRHGGDTSFMGDDSSVGEWRPGPGMISVTKPGSPGFMGLYGADGLYGNVPSPADNYSEYPLENVIAYMTSYHYLRNQVEDTDEHDAAYALEWLNQSLAPGETWTVTAFERWDCGGPGLTGIPEVTAEPAEGCSETVTVHFNVRNWGPTVDAYDLTVTSQNGWSYTLTGDNPLTVNPDSFVPVDVELVIPLTNTDDVLTLTAVSTSDPTLTASADAAIIADCGCTEGNKALVDSPNNGEAFTMGEPMIIQWSTDGVPAEWQDGHVRLSLWKYNDDDTIPLPDRYTKVGRINPDRQPVMAGEHPTWIINQVWDSETQSMIDVEPGDNYLIKIREMERGCHDYSDVVFSIRECLAGEKALIVYPNELSGTEVFNLGQELEIQWSADNVPPPTTPGGQERVKLSLWTADEQTKVGRITLPHVDVRQETFTWIISQVWDSENQAMVDVNAGTYKLKIREVDRGCHHFSDMFIINGCIDGRKALISYPNGGETFDLGQEMTIEWSDDDVPTPPWPPFGDTWEVRISLWQDVNGQLMKFGRIQPDNINLASRQLTWTIDQVFDSELGAMKDVVPGTNYVVKIREKERKCHDYSDAVFTITGPAPADACPEGLKAEIDETNLNPAYAPTDDITIEWTNGPAPLGLVRLSLWSDENGDGVGDAQVGRIVDNIPAGDGTYTWTPSEIGGVLHLFDSENAAWFPVEAGNYLLKVREKGPLPDYRKCHDYSNFAITIE